MGIATDKIPDIPNDMAFNHWHFMQKIKDAIENIDITVEDIIIEGAPPAASSAGTAGDIRWDDTHLYICTSLNTWRRIAHSTW